VLDPNVVYEWLRRYQPFASLSPEAVREIAEVGAFFLHAWAALHGRRAWEISKHSAAAMMLTKT
jgi:hypothetical protein